MTANQKTIREYELYFRKPFTKRQKTAILKRFGKEPKRDCWTEQDIHQQILNFVSCGHFIKPMARSAKLAEDPAPF